MKEPWHMWFKPKTYAAFLSIFLLINCVSATGKSQQIQQEGIAMNFEVLLKGSHSNFDEITNRKISSQQDLNEIFAIINSTRKPGYAVPEVDFTSFDLYFSATGSLSTGGHSLDVHAVNRFPDAIEVRFIKSSPGPGEFAATVISSPFVLVKLAKTDLPLVPVFLSKN